MAADAPPCSDTTRCYIRGVFAGDAGGRPMKDEVSSHEVTPLRELDGDRKEALDELGERVQEPDATAALPGADRAPRAPRQLDRGETVGRFIVLELVGRGGMGEVYAAYDPELDRRVAVKVLRARTRRSEEGRTRLLREAQAIARLSHPSVVVVYDVGTLGDRVFIAMEFLEGRTVRAWSNEKKRAPRDVLAVFVAAGQALAAAHEVGMVHRDFKPDNVMITSAGKVRVMDFGLARQVLGGDDERVTPPTPVDVATPASSPGHSIATITEAGAEMGTPPYMAPEQFARAAKADPRSDQFSFCVALYEALYGERPFPGDTLTALKAAVLSGVVRSAPAHAHVPSWIRRVLLRGLSRAPAHRYPSMSALLGALTNDPIRRTKKILVGIAAIAVLIGVASGGRHLGSTERPSCLGGAEHLAGVWESDPSAAGRTRAIRNAFLQTRKTYAAQAFASVFRIINEYVGRWTGMYADACEATHVRGEQSAAVLDLRMACLEDHLASLRALIDVFSVADGKVVENAVKAAAALPSLDRCADVALLRAVDPPPEDPAARQRVNALRSELAAFNALRDSGQCGAATQKADHLIPAIRSVGYSPLLADALLSAALLGDSCGQPGVMIDRLKEAHLAASASHHDEVAAEASALIAAYAVNRLGQVSVAREWVDVARGDEARLGHETLAKAEVAQAEGELALAQGDYDRALAAADRAFALTRKLRGPDDPLTINGEMNKGDWQRAAGRYAEALRTDLEARAHMERVLGRDHPAVALVCNNEGEALNTLGRYAEAEAAYQRSVDIFHESGADPYLLAWALTGLGRARLGRQEPAAAIVPLEDAMAIRLREGAPPRELAETRFTLARALWPHASDRARALTLAAAARGDAGDDHKLAGEIDAWLARARRGRRS
jgi:eukaryotic-like serine/threonine-protein kinase